MSELQTIQNELFAAERARREATMRGDIEGMTRCLADTFYYAHISGLVENKQQFIARTQMNPKGITFTAARDLAVQVRNGYALLTGKSRIETSTVGIDTLFLSVWEKGKDGWKMSAYASTPLQKSE
jgi:hypothetical protein